MFSTEDNSSNICFKSVVRKLKKQTPQTLQKVLLFGVQYCKRFDRRSSFRLLQVALCVRCFMMKHKDHEVADICDVADDGRHQLQKLKQKCGDVIQNWKEHEDALLKSEQSLNARVGKAIEKIGTTKEDLIKEIEKTASEFEVKISQRHQEQLQDIERMKSKLAYSKESFEELQELMQELIDNSNPSEITKNLSLMKQNYEHLCQKDSKKLDVTTKVRALTFERADISNFADVVFGKIREENLTVVPVHPAEEETRSRPSELIQSHAAGSPPTLRSRKTSEMLKSMFPLYIKPSVHFSSSFYEHLSCDMYVRTYFASVNLVVFKVYCTLFSWTTKSQLIPQDLRSAEHLLWLWLCEQLFISKFFISKNFLKVQHVRLILLSISPKKSKWNVNWIRPCIFLTEQRAKSDAAQPLGHRVVSVRRARRQRRRGGHRGGARRYVSRTGNGNTVQENNFLHSFVRTSINPSYYFYRKCSISIPKSFN